MEQINHTNHRRWTNYSIPMDSHQEIRVAKQEGKMVSPGRMNAIQDGENIKRAFQGIFLALVFLFLIPPQSKASHTWGFEMTYECLSSCSVRVYLRGIRHCGGASGAIAYNPTIVPSAPNCPPLTPVGPTSQLRTWDVTPLCPSQASECDTVGVQVISVEYHEYYRDYSFCNNNSGCDYNFEYQSCCRTYASTVFENNSLGWALNLEVKTGLPTCNSSPIYNTDWEIILVQNDFVRDLGGIDPDGDSLSYEMIKCLRSPSQDAIYKPGFTHLTPLGPHCDLELDPVTGNLFGHFYSTANFATFFCVEITEWRNGSIVGQTTRDLLISPLLTSPNQLPRINPYSNISGGAETSPDQFTMCLGSTLSFDIPTSDPDPNSSLRIWWNQGISNATFSDALNSQVNDTISGPAPIGRFEFTPTNPGTYYFQTRLEDDACPYTGAQEKTIVIHVANTPRLTSQLQSCNEVHLSAFSCGTPPYTYQWSGDAGLSGNGIQAAITYQLQGTYTYQCIVTDANQSQTTLIDSITIPYSIAQPIIDGPDTITGCLGAALQVNALSGFTNYQWSNGFTGTTANVISNGWLVLEAELPSGCRILDSAFIQFAPAVNAQIIQASGTPTIDQCNGSLTATLTASGNYTAYSWSNGSSATQITVNQPGVYHVTAMTPSGCTETDSFEVGFVPPDIYGQVRTSTNTLLSNERVYLIKYNGNSQLLEKVDSTMTDQDGFYYFCNLNSTAAYYVQAHPSTVNFPGELVTYGGGVMVWNETFPLYPSTLGPQQADFNTLPKFLTGGTGSIGGQVLSSQSGNPVSGLRIFLVLNNQAIVGYRDTDANGEFSFGILPTSNYTLVPDRPYVDHIMVPQIALFPPNTAQDSLNLRLHPTFLELVTPTALQAAIPALNFSVNPNPTHRNTTLKLDLPEPGPVKIEVFDIRGNSQGILFSGQLPAGTWSYPWESSLSAGLYFLKVSTRDAQEVQKLLLQ